MTISFESLKGEDRTNDDIDLDVLTLDLESALEDLESVQEQEAIIEKQHKECAELAKLRDSLKEAGEDTSLLNHFAPALETLNISTVDNEFAAEGIDEFLNKLNETEESTEGILKVAAYAVGAITLALLVAYVGSFVIAGVGVLVIGIAYLTALYKTGKYIVGLTKDNDDMLNDRKYKGSDDSANLLKADQCIKMLQFYDKTAQFIIDSADKFDIKAINNMESKFKSIGYTFSDSKFTPKTVLVPSKMTYTAAGWNEANIRKCNEAAKDLGVTLVKFEQVVKVAQEESKNIIKKLKEAKESDKKPTDEEKKAARQAVSIMKAIPKLLISDVKRIASMNRAVIKSTMI